MFCLFLAMLYRSFFFFLQIQSAKKKVPSRDIDTLTDEQLVATVGPHGEIELTLATDNKSVSTEHDSLTDNPFAGKFS